MTNTIIEYFKTSYEINPISQILGLIGIIFSVSAFLTKNDIKTKTLLAISGIIFGIHYFLLGLYSATAADSLGIIRNFAAIKFYNNKKIMWLFLPIYLLSGILTYSNIYSILPIMSGIIATYSFFMLKGIEMRIGLIICCILWLIFNIIGHSIGGIIVESFMIIASLITITRIKYTKKVLL